MERVFIRLDIIGEFDEIFACTEIGTSKSNTDIFFATAGYVKGLTKNAWFFKMYSM